MASRFGERHELTMQILQRKERLWGQGDRKYNAERSAKNLVYGTQGNEPSIDLLRWAADATDDELIGAAQSRDDDYGFLYYK